MNYVAVTQYPNLMFDESVMSALSNANLSKQAKLALLDAFNRLNRYGLDSMMVGSRLEKSSDGETGTLHILDDDVSLALTIEAKEYIIVSCCECRKLGIVGL
ncbi:hypothetical protein [Bacillus sp. C1]